MSTDTDSLLKELVGNQCRCGKRKQRRQTFCKSCYFKLPMVMRRDLYQRFGAGYEEAYSAAVEHLEKV